MQSTDESNAEPLYSVMISYTLNTSSIPLSVIFVQYGSSLSHQKGSIHECPIEITSFNNNNNKRVPLQFWEVVIRKRIRMVWIIFRARGRWCLSRGSRWWKIRSISNRTCMRWIKRNRNDSSNPFQSQSVITNSETNTKKTQL